MQGELIEQALRQARSVVGDVQAPLIPLGLDADADPGVGGLGVDQGFGGVAQQVDDRDLDLHRIAFNPGGGVLAFQGCAVDGHAGRAAPRAGVEQGALADLPQVQALMLCLDVPQQSTHLLDREHDAIGFVANALHLLLPAAGERAEVDVLRLLDQQLAVEQQDAERLIDFVGHGSSLQAAAQLVFQQCQGLGIAVALFLSRFRQAGFPFPQLAGEAVVAIHQLP